ncbi:glycerol-3-phosphate 1-O-acyltransferase PlsY [Alphaproteobacteria bacterium]|nr:glycerol-3-phosphate 1-O-acyltransferase PlsY [Alphaproteobacteria bacterium]
MEYLYLSFAYLVGSIPFGLIVTKILTGKNITEEGSGNIGATNVFRIVSKKIGAMVLLLDALKPVIALILIRNYDYIFFDNYKVAIIFFSVIGHIYPIWLKFKGGKGVATLFGGFLFINPYTAILSIITWVLMVKITKLSSLGALVSIFILTMANFIFIDGGFNKSLILILMIIIYYKHKDNIKRLINKSENKIDL